MCLRWQTVGNLLPVLPTITAAPNSCLSLDAHTELIAFFQHHIDGLRVVGVDNDRKAEATWQLVFANIDPIIPTIVAAIHTAVVLLEEDIWTCRMQCQLMDTLSELWKCLGLKIGQDVFVARLPASAIVISAIYPCG